MLFRNWLTGAMGTPGDYSYQSIHLLTTLVVLVATVAVAFFGSRNKNHPQRNRGLLVAISVFQLAFEIGWRIIYRVVSDAPLATLWPMYPCNLGGILLPSIALVNWQTGKKMFYLFGFVGGVLTFAIADGIFSSDVLVFPIVKSILQHTGLLLIPMLEYVSGTYRPTLKHLGWVILGCLIHLINCEVSNRIFRI